MKFNTLFLAAFAVAKIYALECGKNIGKCKSGYCCSKYGWCGKTKDYCGSGCQEGYGLCDSSNQSSNISTNGRCGPNNGNTVCPSGQCCSKYGWCGTKIDYCGSNCLPNFGKCGNVSTTTTTTTTTKVEKPTNHPLSTDGKCGPKNNNTYCPNNECCSIHGWCGNSVDHCGNDCQSEFGRCGTTTSTTSTSTTSKPTSTSKPKYPISTDGRCGADFGTSCPYGSCCSKYGWCSPKDTHCNEGCQHDYGDCAEDIAKRITVFTKCVNDKHWALTFDDGPHIYDEDLLDFLKSKNVKATFFVKGNSMDLKSEEVRKVIKRMYNEGHEIENHTFNHVNLTIHTPEEIVTEVTKLELAIEDIIGKKPAFIRPPYGEGAYEQHVQETIQSLGYNGIIMWNVDTMDWDNKGDIDYAISKFREHLDEPIISLNHNRYSEITKEKLINSAKEEIEYMIRKGYTPVTMSVCTGRSAYKN